MTEPPIDREDYSHPEKIYKNLVFVPDEKNEPREELPVEVREKMRAYWQMVDPDDDVDLKKEELCWTCGWTAYDESLASYGSRIRIAHTRSNLGIWDVGSRWMVRDQPNDASLGNDFMTQEFLRKQPGLDIPILKEMRVLSEPTDKVVLTLMSKA